MGHRPGFLISRRVPCDGGESPNAYFPQVTVEVRVYYPARQMELAAEVLAEAVEEATAKLAARIEAGKPHG